MLVGASAATVICWSGQLAIELLGSVLVYLEAPMSMASCRVDWYLC